MKTSFIITFTILISSYTFSQNEFKDYTPPKISEGSNLIFSARSGYRDEHRNYLSRGFYLDLSPSLSKWHYSEKLNYIAQTQVYTNFSVHKFSDEDYLSDDANAGLDLYLNSAANYYFTKNRLYAGMNLGVNASYDSKQKPREAVYVAPNLGYGKIVDASAVEKMLVFEKFLTELKFISKPLGVKTKKMLTELIDRRNNTEFIYKFKDDNEIEFFEDVEKLLRERGEITGTLSSRSVLRLYQVLTHPAYLFYPKYKGLQAQLLYYYPKVWGEQEDFILSMASGVSGSNFPPKIVLSGIYGLPVSYRTQFAVYAYLARSLKLEDDQGEYQPLSAQNLFPLIAFNRQVDNRYAIDDDALLSFYGNDKFRFQTSLYAYHNFTDFFGVRAAAVFSARNKFDDSKLFLGFSQSATLDYSILTRMGLSVKLQADEFNTSTDGYYYGIDISARVSYFIF